MNLRNAPKVEMCFHRSKHVLKTLVWTQSAWLTLPQLRRARARCTAVRWTPEATRTSPESSRRDLQSRSGTYIATPFRWSSRRVRRSLIWREVRQGCSEIHLPVTALKEMPRPTPKKCKVVFTGNVYHIGAGASGAVRGPVGPVGGCGAPWGPMGPHRPHGAPQQKTIAKRSKMTSEASQKKEFALPYHSNRYRYHRPEE